MGLVLYLITDVKMAGLGPLKKVLFLLKAKVMTNGRLILEKVLL